MELAFSASTLRYNQVAYLLLSIPGVSDFTALTINGGTGNVSIGDEQVPVKGTVTLAEQMDRLSAGLSPPRPRSRPSRGAGQQTEALWTAENGLIDQLDVNKATWGLSCWEASLGLDVDVSRPDAYRRTRILSKLRGQGATTVAMIQNVAESFYNGQVAVEEQPEAYRFDIRFLSSIGVPPNLDDLSAALEEIKPAHLAYDYIILYRTWGELEEKTWGELESRTWDEILGGEL